MRGSTAAVKMYVSAHMSLPLRSIWARLLGRENATEAAQKEAMLTLVALLLLLGNLGQTPAALQDQAQGRTDFPQYF